MLDRCHADPNSAGYFESACSAVGYNTPDIHARKKGYYECFLAQLTSNVVTSGGPNGILTDRYGNPIKAGQ
jgi:hypothetical protein